MKILSAFLLISLTPASVFAQSPTPAPTPTPTQTPEPQPTPEPPPPPVRVEFSVFVWPTEGILLDDATIAPVPRAFFRTEQGHVPVRLIRNAATPLYSYTGDLPLVLYDVEEVWTPPPPDAPPETEPTVELRPIPVIQASFPRHWRRVMLIVFPGRRSEDGTLLTLALPYDLEQLQPGMARIFNASPETLYLEFPETEHVLTLRANQPVDFHPRRLTETGFARVFVYRQNARGESEMVYTSRLFMDPETTNYFFLYPQRRNRIRILRIAGHAGDTPGILP